MKRITTTLLGLFSLGSLVAALAAGPALADTAKDKDKADPTKGKPDVRLAPVKVELTKTSFRLLTRKARAYKAIELVDPKTKKKYAPDDTVTAPNGKKFKAREYVAKLNELEKKLNEMGHSLHDAEEKVKLARNEVKGDELDKKAQPIAANHLKFDAKTMRAVVKRDEQEKRHTAGAKKDEDRVKLVRRLLVGKADPKADAKAPAKADAKSSLKSAVKPDAKAATAAAAKAPAKAVAPKGTTKKWHYELGRRNIMAASLDAKLETSGNSDRVKVLGEVSADGYLANKKQNLVKATGVITVPKAGASTLNVSVSVLGRSVYNKNLSKTVNWSHKDELSKSFDKSVSFRFQLGPIPLSVKLGARGTAGIRYFIGVRPLSAEAQFVPFVRGEAYAQCGIDIVVASVGIGGKLRLIDFELRIGGELAIKFDKSQRPMLSEHAYVQSNITMLKGSLYVFASVNVLFWKKKYEWDIWDWKGFSKTGYLVNVHKTHNLF
jgi:hypothetical protein